MILKPINEKILVERKIMDEKTKSGLLLPQEVNKTKNEGVVVETGEGYLTDSGAYVKLEVKKNDYVIFSSNSGIDLTIDGKKYVLLTERDILAIIKG